MFARRAQIVFGFAPAMLSAPEAGSDDNTTESQVTFRKYLVLAGVTVFAAAGDSMLSHGMKQTGNISLHHLQGIILAGLNPWVAAGHCSAALLFRFVYERAFLGRPDLCVAGHIAGIRSAGAGGKVRAA